MNCFIISIELRKAAEKDVPPPGYISSDRLISEANLFW